MLYMAETKIRKYKTGGKFMKILIVAGNWSDNEELIKKSGIAEKTFNTLAALPDMYSKEGDAIKLCNGGRYSDLADIIETAPDFDIIFWWANVDNSLPKVRNVKEIAPYSMLVNSKHNDDDKYTFQELTQRTLAAKANLTFEFKKNKETGRFDILVFDPLGCGWYKGNDITEAVTKAAERLKYLISITRQSTTKSDESNGLVLSWYFDRFKENMNESNEQKTIPDETEFVDLVRSYAEIFQTIMKPAKDVKRFLGNASFKPMPPQVGRCGKGMPSFRKDGYIFVSQRNVDKQFIDINHFVPTYLGDDKVYYCGENKPSVDTPIQLRLYEAMPEINYMIHSHCYVKDAPFTEKCIPCGALEEVPEMLETIKKHTDIKTVKTFRLNLKGHGSIIFGNTINDLRGVDYYGRTLPEIM